jgi:hypothetical protein
MEALLRLRHQVYRGCSLHGFLDPDADPAAADAFDARSYHLGVFPDSSAEPPVGYARVVTTATSPQAVLLPATRRAEPTRPATVADPGQPLLPSLGYWRRSRLRQTVEEHRAAGSRVAEASRLAVAPHARHAAVSRGIMLGLLTLFWQLEIGLGVLTCRPEHCRTYERMGFAPMDSGDLPPVQGVRIWSMALERSRLHPAWAARVDAVGADLAAGGGITLGRSTPLPRQHSKELVA